MFDISHMWTIYLFMAYWITCSSTGCIVLNGRMIISNWNNWKGCGRKQLWHSLRYSLSYMERQGKTMIKPSRDLNQGPPLSSQKCYLHLTQLAHIHGQAGSTWAYMCFHAEFLSWMWSVLQNMYTYCMFVIGLPRVISSEDMPNTFHTVLLEITVWYGICKWNEFSWPLDRVQEGDSLVA